MIDRDKVFAFAKANYWRPLPDGIVWVAYGPIDVNAAAKRAKESKKATEDFVGVFLWYASSFGSRLEMLALVPKSKESEIEAANDDDRLWSKYSSVGVALASYKDDPTAAEENLAAFPTPPPYHGLNDCTHFTSQCLVEGGFPITSTKKDDEADRARRGAGDLAHFLDAASETKTLCMMASHADARAVVEAGVMKKGDVLAYYKDTEQKYAHHTVPAVSSNTVAMHTEHAFDIAWDFGKDDTTDERYSLFHWADDDYTTGDAKQWLGWWKVETLGDPSRDTPEVDYYHFGDTGTLTVTRQEPTQATDPPSGTRYRWFATDSSTAVVVRRKETETKVETFTQSDDTPASATGAFSNLPEGSTLRSNATKLF